MKAISAAVVGLCEALNKLPPEDQRLILPALALLGGAVAETEVPVGELFKFARVFEQLGDLEPGERMRAMCARLQLSKATYYRRLDELQARSLIPVSRKAVDGETRSS